MGSGNPYRSIPVVILVNWYLETSAVSEALARRGRSTPGHRPSVAELEHELLYGGESLCSPLMPIPHYKPFDFPSLVLLLPVAALALHTLRPP